MYFLLLAYIECRCHYFHGVFLFDGVKFHLAGALVMLVPALSRNVREGIDCTRVRALLVGLLLFDYRLLIIVKIVTHLLVRGLQWNLLAMLLTIDIVLLNHGRPSRLQCQSLTLNVQSVLRM